MLTPTMKLNRAEISRQYAKEIAVSRDSGRDSADDRLSMAYDSMLISCRVLVVFMYVQYDLLPFGFW